MVSSHWTISRCVIKAIYCKISKAEGKKLFFLLHLASFAGILALSRQNQCNCQIAKLLFLRWSSRFPVLNHLTRDGHRRTPTLLSLRHFVVNLHLEDPFVPKPKFPDVRKCSMPFRWSPGAEDHTRSHSAQLRTGKSAEVDKSQVDTRRTAG